MKEKASQASKKELKVAKCSSVLIHKPEVSKLDKKRRNFFWSTSEQLKKEDILSLGIDHFDKNGLQLNPNIDPQFMETYMPKDINYALYSNNINCTIDYVKAKGPELFCFQALSDNMSIHPRDIVENEEFPWERAGLSRNPNFTLRFFYEHDSTFPIDVKEYFKFHDIRRRKRHL